MTIEEMLGQIAVIRIPADSLDYSRIIKLANSQKKKGTMFVIYTYREAASNSYGSITRPNKWKRDIKCLSAPHMRTFKEERQRVMQALLELDCIPAGMELFPAANEDQWTLIKRVIDDCDYYIVIIAARYGSLGPSGLSYTEMEYRYAIELNKPIIGFIYRDPDTLPMKRSEQDGKLRQQLEAFRDLVKERVCQFWQSPADLGGKVSRSLVKLIKMHPATGWLAANCEDAGRSR